MLSDTTTFLSEGANASENVETTETQTKSTRKSLVSALRVILFYALG